MYLLDTNVMSKTRKPRPHGAVLGWIRSLASNQLALSAVTLGELQRGVEQVRKQDVAKADEIEAWIDALGRSVEVIVADGEIFRAWAVLMKGRARHSWEDALIAATAHKLHLTIATRNIQDFEGLGVDVFNPFTYVAGQ